jgi:hypothetical protein
MRYWGFGAVAGGTSCAILWAMTQPTRKQTFTLTIGPDLELVVRGRTEGEMTIKETGIRPYGPGKFSTIVDAYVYDVLLDGGCDDECGESEAGGWFGLMRHGHSIFRDHDPMLETLTEAEAELIKGCAGVIVSEDSQGFVSVEYFDTTEALEAEWARIQAEVNSDTYDHYDGDSGKLLVSMPVECAEDCSTPGQAADEPVSQWLKDERVIWHADMPTLRKSLKRYGAWDDLQTADEAVIKSRVLWLAAGDWRER